ncbi:MAG: hypothetical protein R3F10_05885 [Lysobacteraceae bacterium]
MFKLIIETAVRFRWAVVVVATVIAAYGPVPARQAADRRSAGHHQQAGADQHDCASGAPGQIERRSPTARNRAGRHPGLTSTRSLSRNGFSQVTAIFTDQTDIYFARQQVAERMRSEVQETCRKR